MIIRHTLSVVLLALAVSCVSVEYVRISDEKAAPKALNCDLEIFSTKLPARDYVELGILEAEGSGSAASLKDLLPEMKRKACEAGGDAIILSGSQRSTTTSGTVSPGTGGTVATTPHLHANATVVRWRD